MTNETRRIIRDGFGHIEDELRSQRIKLDYIIRMLGGRDAQVSAVREDVGALQERSSEHERKLSQHAQQLASLAR